MIPNRFRKRAHPNHTTDLVIQCGRSGERIGPSNVLVWSLMVLAVSCSVLSGGESSPAPQADVTLVVDNRNFNDATIYARGGDNRVRLGRVTGKTSQEFTFNWYQSDLFVEVDFTGGGRLFSQRQVVVPGDVDDFVVTIGISPNGPVMLTGR